MTDFPIFDLSRFEQAGPAARAALGAEVDEICRTTGFLAISGHSVPEQTIATAWDAARSFFDLSPEEKNKARAPYAGYPYGYLGPGVEALAKSKGADTPPDLKESFNGGPLSVPPGLRRSGGARLLLRRDDLAVRRQLASSTRGRPTMPRWRTLPPASCASSPWR